MKTPVTVCVLLSSGLLRVSLAGQQPAEQSLASLKPAPGLELTLWASEPALTNPTNMAIDERGPVPTLRAMERDFRPDEAAGRKVFEGAAGCAACHSLGGARKIGPDLSAAGNKFGRQALLDAIVNPSEGIAPEFLLWTLTTKNQGEVAGLLVEDSADRVVLKTGPDEEVRIKPSDISARKSSRLSMMPEGLLNTLTTQQITDLLEFLTTLKGSAATTGGPR